tara:strand:+ start:2038 stop:2172 length:135 start_codon:yes stop_codon:yes gene_type:complete
MFAMALSFQLTTPLIVERKLIDQLVDEVADEQNLDAANPGVKLL